MAIVVRLAPSEGERACRWEWKPLPAVSPRLERRPQEGYEPNPPARNEKSDDITVCIQPLLCGGETATAWALDRQEGASTLFVSVAHSFPGQPFSLQTS